MKILSLDGGGVFGFAQAKILHESGCYDKFDCIVGTSIGSAIATAIALGKGDVIGQPFFDEWMPKIFKASFFRRINIFTTKYPDDNLNAALQSVFDGDLLGHAEKPLFVTAVNIASTQLKVFYSGSVEDSSLPAWQVVRCATAAETYFSPMSGYGDGGVMANNPSMVAVASASKVLNVPIPEMEILSIGTGEKQNSCKVPWWRLGWGLWLIDSLMEGSSNSMHNYFVNSLPVKRYTKINFVRQPDWAMDNPSDMKKAETAWANDITKAIKVVRDF